MKRLIIRIGFMSLILLLTSNFGYASSQNTVIKLTLGQSIVRINEDSIKGEKAYVSQGTTMVPLRIITEAFGAKVEWNQKERSVKIINSNTNIKVAIGKKMAVVNGISKLLLCSPQMVNETTMVPLRFISENFNAKVLFDGKSKEISVVIPFEDYENRFKYLKQGMIGDSFYGWSVSFPKGCKIVEKQPSGTSILVKNQDEGYYYYIYSVRTEAVKNEADMLKQLLSYVDGESIISQSIIENNGRKWADIVLESEDEIYEYRAALENQRIYQMHFYISSKDDYYNASKSKVFKEVINSFSLNYKGNDATVRDINEIKQELYTYRDKNFGWTIDLIATINIDFKNSTNHYEIVDERGAKDGITCGVEFYSTASGESLDSYVEQKNKELYEDINKDYIKGWSIENIQVGGISAKKVRYEIIMGESTCIFYDLYLIKGKYKYNVYLYGKSELFSEKEIKLYDKIFKSFLPIEQANSGEIADNSTELRTRTLDHINTEQNWSFKYPAIWNLMEDAQSKTVSLTDRLGFLEVYISAAKGISEDMVKLRLTEKIDELKKLKAFRVIADQAVVEKNIPMTKYVCEYELEGLKYNYKAYIFKVKDTVYGIHFTVADVVNSESVKKRLDSLWESVKIFDLQGEDI